MRRRPTLRGLGVLAYSPHLLKVACGVALLYAVWGYFDGSISGPQVPSLTGDTSGEQYPSELPVWGLQMASYGVSFAGDCRLLAGISFYLQIIHERVLH